ncbi:MAG: sulfite exporter TauE/SafE family protein [Gemmatimonadales bacterium]
MPRDNTDVTTTGTEPPRRFLWIFGLWLAGFYAVWLWLNVVEHHWATAVAHWPIAVAMAFGSYFAGSTPMGGGTIGFPVLVLAFHGPATLGRDFSFAVQSIGMTSASIFIMCARVPVQWRMLRWALAGSLIGTPLGLVFVAPHVSSLEIKVLFAVIWASFGVMTFVKLREIAGAQGITPLPDRFHRLAGLLVGLFGGMFAAAITGVGIDMIIYAVLVLICHADLKTAIPTSVILMAFNSIVGITTRHFQGDLNPEVFGNWIAASPVVALGAPFGAFIVNRIGRKKTLWVVALLCLGQFVWTCMEERANLGLLGMGLAVGGVLLFNLGFHFMYKLGQRYAANGRRVTAPREIVGRAVEPAFIGSD